MKKIFMLILSLTMAFSAAAFVGCGDNGGTSESVAGSSAEEQAKDVSVTFTVKDQDGLKIANVKVTFEPKNGATVSATSDENGAFTVTLKAGEYSVSYESDYATSGGYYLPETTGIVVKEGVGSMVLYMNNNTPNGTEGREFPLAFGENEITLPANTAYYYIIYRAVNLYAEIEGATAKATYREETYSADGEGKIQISLLGTSTNSVEVLLIENTSAEAQTYRVNIQSAPGSQGNPYTLVLDTELTTKPLVSGENEYYTYTATAAGTLTVTVKTDKSYVSMTNATNSVNASTGESEDGVINLTVAEGDEVIIVCSSETLDDGTESAVFIASFTPSAQE